MLPLSGSSAAGGGINSNDYRRYFRRMMNRSSMDFEYNLWQMLHLCTSPSKVYRISSYHKQTKNQWARDDPAFVVLLLLFITTASIAYGIAFHRTLSDIISVIFSFIFVDFLAVGLVLSTICWALANRYLRVQSTHGVEQKVEWAYSWDIHCNAYFPLFLILYVAQYFLLYVVLDDRLIASIIANALYAIAFIYYFYITFLGYNALPFLSPRTLFFLFPIAFVLIGYLAACLLNFNISHKVLYLYFGAKDY